MKPIWDSFGLRFEEHPTDAASDRRFLAQAQNAHETYLHALQDWEAWLNQRMRFARRSGTIVEEAPNAIGVMLDYAIDDVIRRLRAGEWRGESPTAEDLESLLDNSRYAAFHEAQQQKRTAVNDAAAQVVALLSRADLVEQFDNQPWYDQLGFLADVSERLHETTVGRNFLHAQLSAPTQEEQLKLFSPWRILALTGSIPVDGFAPVALIDDLLTSNTARAGDRQAATIVAALRYYHNLLPVLVNHETAQFGPIFPYVANHDVAQLGQFFIEWFQLFLARDHFVLVTSPQPTVLSDLLKQLDDWRASVDRTITSTIGPWSNLLRSAVVVTRLYFDGRAFYSDPNVVTGAEFASSLGDAYGVVTDVVEGVWSLRGSVTTFSTSAARLSIFLGVIDGIAGTANGIAAYRQGNYGRAVGGAVSSIGGYTETAIGVLFLLQRATGILVATPATLIAGLLIAVVLKVAGHFMMTASNRGALKTWFANNYFGKNWPPAVEDVNDAGSMLFRWENERSGEPRISRQVSELNSLFFPLFAHEDPPDEFSAVPFDADIRVEVDLRPAVPLRDGGVVPFLRGDESISILAFDGIQRRPEPLYQGLVKDVSFDPRFPVSGFPLVWREGGFVERWKIAFLFRPNNVPDSIEVRVAGSFGVSALNLSDFERIDAFPMASVLRRKVASP